MSESGFATVLPGTMAEIAPQASPGTQAELILAGTRYPVELKTTDSHGNLRIDSISHAEVFEPEDYEYTDNTFSLKEAAEEHYSPAVPLLAFPIRTNPPMTWEGTMTTGLIGRKATATITTTTETLYVQGLEADTLKVVVDLNLNADPNRPPLKRQLIFWFRKGHGLIKREFGSASIRQPPNSQ